MYAGEKKFGSLDSMNFLNILTTKYRRSIIQHLTLIPISNKNIQFSFEIQATNRKFVTSRQIQIYYDINP